MDAKLRIDVLIGDIRRKAADARGLLVPVSGGSDSALGFWLCTQAFPNKIIAIHAGEKLRCQEWFVSVGTVAFVDTPGDHAEREEMRWARFLAFSLARNLWLVGCRNRTEDELGTYSLSSRVASYLPLVGIWKSDVMEMCAEIGVPEEIVASSFRADPDCGRPQEMAEIPFEAIDAYLRWRSGEQVERLLTDPQARYIERVLERNAFKKALPLQGPKF